MAKHISKFPGFSSQFDLTEWMRAFANRRNDKFRGLPLSVLLDTRDAITVTPDGRAVPMHSPRLQKHTLDIIFDHSCKIGQDVTDDSPINIGISERRSGLYILGKPRMGKSWLMVNLILQDIERSRGIFFLDPHGDAIDDLINRTTSEVILLDPEKEEYAFGINLLECPNIDNMAARADTFSKAKGVFDKLWKNTFDEKPWLQMILQNTLYAFIETQGLTLVNCRFSTAMPNSGGMWWGISNTTGRYGITGALPLLQRAGATRMR